MCTGTFKNGKADGKASLVFTTGESYTGNFTNGEYEGSGKFTYPEIGYYDGQFKNSTRNGTGRFSWDNGDEYNGEWVDDQITGEGKMSFSNGDVLDGEFSDGVLFTGTYKTTENDTSYTLSLENGFIVQATVEFEDGTVCSADVNGSANIIRKAVPNAFEGIEDYGFLHKVKTVRFHDLHSCRG